MENKEGEIKTIAYEECMQSERCYLHSLILVNFIGTYDFLKENYFLVLSYLFFRIAILSRKIGRNKHFYIFLN